jgi:hypothetical protein
LEFLGLWLDYKESRGLFENFSGESNFILFFELKNPWAWSTGCGPLEPRSTVDQPPLPAGVAHQSPAYGCSEALGPRPRAGEGEWRTGTRWAAHRRPGDGGRRWQPKTHGGGALRCERGSKEGGVGCGEVRCGRAPLYRGWNVVLEFKMSVVSAP